MIALNDLMPLIIQYRYHLLLPLAIIEGPIVTVIAAFLSSLHILDIYVVYVIAVAGDLIGDAIYYWVGRLGRNTIIPRYGKYLGITEERINYAENHYRNNLKKTIFWGKLTQAPNLIILVTAGVAKVDFKRFLTIIFLVTLPKVLVFTAIGYYFGKSYQLIDRYLKNSILTTSIVMIFAGLLYWLYHIYNKSKNPK